MTPMTEVYYAIAARPETDRELAQACHPMSGVTIPADRSAAYDGIAASDDSPMRNCHVRPPRDFSCFDV